MNKKIIFIIFIIFLLPRFASALLGEERQTIINNHLIGLTKLQADNLYCKLNGTCTLNNLIVLNNTEFVNITVINYTVTGDLGVSGYAYFSNNTYKSGNSINSTTELFNLFYPQSWINTLGNWTNDNDTVVHIEGAETITGAKTFTNTINRITGNLRLHPSGPYDPGSTWPLYQALTINGHANTADVRAFRQDITLGQGLDGPSGLMLAYSPTVNTGSYDYNLIGGTGGLATMGSTGTGNALMSMFSALWQYGQGFSIASVTDANAFGAFWFYDTDYSGTITNLNGISLNNPYLGGGLPIDASGTFENVCGLNIGEISNGGSATITNVAALRVKAPAANTATNQFTIFQTETTAPNIFEADTTFGSTNNPLYTVDIHGDIRVKDNTRLGDASSDLIYFTAKANTNLNMNNNDLNNVGNGYFDFINSISVNTTSVNVDNGYFDFVNSTTLNATNGNFAGDADVTGNITGNSIYGEMNYHNHTATEVNFVSQYANYTLFMTEADSLNGFTFVGGGGESSNLTAQVSGKYDVYAKAIGDGQNNHVYILSVFVNDIAVDNCDAHKKMSAGGDIVTMSTSCFIDLNIGDDINLKISDWTGTGTGNYYGGSLKLVRVGD